MLPGKHQEPGAAARAVAQKECKAILHALASRKKIHVSIHEARKAIRRQRALLSLIEERLVDVAAIDRVFEHLGDSLSALRDAHVVIATAKRLAIKNGKEQWIPVIERLTDRRDTFINQALVRDRDFQRRRAKVERAAGQLADLSWQELTLDDLHDCLKRSRHRVAKAVKRTDSDPTADNLHRWRRRVRKLRMQMEAVVEIAPDLVKSSDGKKVKALHKLSDELGEQHDMQVLASLLRRMTDLPNRQALLQQLENE